MKIRKTKKFTIVRPVLMAGLAATLIACISPASAQVTFSAAGTGPGPVPISASATFSILGDNLSVTLTNTAPSNSGQDVPGSTLTGVFFDLPDSFVLTPWSATIAAGSILGSSFCYVAATCATTTNVGGEFGYQVTSLPGGADRGIASSGYLSTGLPGNVGNFENNGVSGGLAGTDLANPASLDGINFGIISAAPGYNPNGGNGGLANVPVIQDTVTFLFHGATGLSYSTISHVSFQYGTALTEANITTSVPEPEIYAMLLAGLGLMGFVARRRKRHSEL